MVPAVHALQVGEVKTLSAEQLDVSPERIYPAAQVGAQVEEIAIQLAVEQQVPKPPFVGAVGVHNASTMFIELPKINKTKATAFQITKKEEDKV